MNPDNRYQPPKAQVADVVDSAFAAAGPEQLGSRWARLGGSIIDGLILLALAIPYFWLSGSFEQMMSGTFTVTNAVQSTVFGVLAYLAVNGYLLHRYGQTVGKRVADLRIVAIDEARILPWWKVFLLRYALPQAAGQVPGVGPIFALVNVLFIFRSDKRCIHDLIAGTRVIKASIPWKRYDEQ